MVRIQRLVVWGRVPGIEHHQYVDSGNDLAELQHKHHIDDTRVICFSKRLLFN